MLPGTNPQRVGLWLTAAFNGSAYILPGKRPPKVVACDTVGMSVTAAPNQLVASYTIEQHGPIVKAAWYVYYVSGALSLFGMEVVYNPYRADTGRKCCRKPHAMPDHILDRLAEMTAKLRG